MKKFFLLIATTILIFPFWVSAQDTSLTQNYSQIMTRRLTFSLNRNARQYNRLVEQNKLLTINNNKREEIDHQLVETKALIDHGQNRLTMLASAPNSGYAEVKGIVREIIGDVRQSYAKIREIRLLIKKAN